MGDQTQGIRSYIRAHLPLVALLYGGVIASLLLIGAGLVMGWYALIPFALALLVITSYFFATVLLRARQLYGGGGQRSIDTLIDYAGLRPENRAVYIDLGRREGAVEVARHLTTGEVVVIDVYNPQSHLSGRLRRARAAARRYAPDPRVTWVDGAINLLPVPDQSVGIVFLNEILSEFWLDEERAQLLDEVRRILVPEGRLLLAEQVRTQSNLVLTGLVTSGRHPAGYWQTVLADAGFTIKRHETLRNLIYCARADKPLPEAGRQLSLHLEYV